MKLTKYRKRVNEKLEKDKAYALDEASALLKDLINVKFDPSVDLHVRLGVDPRKADQAIRGTVSLPHGTGRTKTVLVFCTPDKEEEAKEAGADYVGLDEYIEKIQKGWLEFDTVIATPNVMPQIAKLGRVLGPRNLMPNPKSGTVTNEVGAAVEDVKKGKIAFKVDKFGIIHTAIGRGSFSAEQIKDNAQEMVQTLAKIRPASAKGNYFKSITLTSTMGPGIAVDAKSIKGV